MAFLRLPLRLPAIQELAIPGVSILITFLAYSSQYLFYYIEPEHLTRSQAIWFNSFVLAIWWCYERACDIDPGPKGWINAVTIDEGDGNESELAVKSEMRWCKKCEAVKPPRAHHCRQCGRCIPKMDHHCPWTTNCVSHTTFPHFFRFVLYAVMSMSILEYHLLCRCKYIWDNRNLPAYLGPPIWAMAHLMILVVVNSVTLFALGILLARAVYSLTVNTSMIESWEIERHEALVDRSSRTGGFVYANGGQRMRIERQEFPYDIGVWKNICQAMGTNNPIVMLLPFGGGPDVKFSADWEVNGFEDKDKVWPPPDPDKLPRSQRIVTEEPDTKRYESNEEQLADFRRRQQQDYQRWDRVEEPEGSDEYESEYEEGIDGEPGWTNSDGDRLRDYGVDEEAEVLADDEIPLGELLRRRKARPFE